MSDPSRSLVIDELAATIGAESLDSGIRGFLRDRKLLLIGRGDA